MIKFYIGLFIGVMITVSTADASERTLGGAGYDSTDPPGEDVRSGLTVRIDEATGCHYLYAYPGALEPRVDRRGDHICTGRKGEDALKQSVINTQRDEDIRIMEERSPY